jgi:carbamoyltransferase
MEYFDYGAGLRMTNERFARLFGGPPRAPEGKLTEREMDMARSIQAVTEEVMLRMARFAHELTGCEHLVLAGGVALNCVGNGRLLREGPFARLWIQPAAGDAGGALGAALFVHHQLLGGERRADGVHDAQRASLLGPAYGDDEIGRFLAGHGVEADRCETADALAGLVADRLADGKVVGWFQGRMEFGPRALGARSILGDPRDLGMQSTLNLKIKFRESFRPFAPAVAREHLAEYFDLDRESPYMLLTAGVAAGQRKPAAADVRGLDKLKLERSRIPAVTHVDGSARVQTVDREDHPLFHELLAAFRERTGCPVLVNTSFNVRGEPIVRTPEEAYRSFRRTNMDVLVLGSYVVEKKAHEAAREMSWYRDDATPAADDDPWAAGRDEAFEGRHARRFGLVWTAVLAALAAGVLYLDRPVQAAAFAAAGVAVVLAAFFAAPVWTTVYRLWTKLAMVLGRLVSKLVLVLFYYLVLTPAGLAKRLFGEPALDTAVRDGRETYWQNKPDGTFTVERYRKLH